MITKTLGTIGKIIIPKKIERVINILHTDIGATEWSGILLYKLTKGNIKNLKNLEFTVKFIYPMDIGTSVYTEHKFDPDFMDIYDTHNIDYETDIGHVHTHHSMTTFFSSTDTSELEDNCKHHNYYLSLIVNFAKNYCAKVAIYTEDEVTSYHSFKGSDGKPIKVKSSKKENTMLVGDLDIEIEGNVDSIEWLDQRIVKLQEDKKAKSVVSTYNNVKGYEINFPEYSQRNNRNWGYEEDLEKELKYLENKVNYTSKNTTEDFLTKLILLDEETKVTSLEAAINATDKELNNDPTQIDIYSETLDVNFDVFHFNTFGDMESRKTAIKSANILLDLESKFPNSPTLNAMQEVVSQYV